LNYAIERPEIYNTYIQFNTSKYYNGYSRLEKIAVIMQILENEVVLIFDRRTFGMYGCNSHTIELIHDMLNFYGAVADLKRAVIKTALCW